MINPAITKFSREYSLGQRPQVPAAALIGDGPRKDRRPRVLDAAAVRRPRSRSKAIVSPARTNWDSLVQSLGLRQSPCIRKALALPGRGVFLTPVPSTAKSCRDIPLFEAAKTTKVTNSRGPNKSRLVRRRRLATIKNLRGTVPHMDRLSH
jgi:hypothetical protein